MAVSNGFRQPLGNGNLTEVAGDADGYHVEANFGWYNPAFGAQHLGEDWNADGSTLGDLGQPVYAISNGTVVERGYDDAFGNYLIIRHDLPSPITVNGITTSKVYSMYGHFQNPAIVSVGDVVSIGQQVGNVGMTGEADGNSHVHLEIRLGYGSGFTNMTGYAYGGLPAGWIDPTDFINAHRTFDAVIPLLTSASPADNATGVDVGSNIVLTFNESVRAGSGNIVIYNANGSVAQTIAVTDTSQVNITGNTVTINPTSDLAANSGYYVNLAAGVIKDLAGNNYAGITNSTALNFTTGALDFAGNTLAAARVVTLGSTVSTFSDYVGPSDPFDYYKFTTASTASFALTMNGLSSDADVYLLNASGAEIAHSYNTGTAAEAINVGSLAAGTYYVQVRPYNTASTSYNLAMSASPVAADMAGNTMANARAVTLGSAVSTFSDYVGPSDTLDYYKFTTAGVTNFALNMTGLTADADVYLLNASGKEVAHSYNTGTTPEAINVNSLAAGTYYVQVRPYGSAATNYNLSLSASPITTTDMAGNTMAAARVVTLGSTVSTFNDYVGPSDTLDYYKFTTAGATNFALNMTGLSADADVYLLNASGAEVSHSYNFGTAAESISVNNLAAGTYYVQVRPYQNAATNYTLDLSASPVGAKVAGTTGSNNEANSAPVSKDFSLEDRHDFNADGRNDLFFANNTTHGIAIWEIDGSQVIANPQIGIVNTAIGYQAVGSGDFNGDLHTDLLFFNPTTGGVAVWEMNGTQVLSNPQIGFAPAGSHLQTTGDFNGDGATDLLFINDMTHAAYVWELNGTNIIDSGHIGTINAAGGWSFERTADFNGDAKADLLFLNQSTGGVAIWQMNGTTVEANPQVGIMPSGSHFQAVGDFNGDGKADLLFVNDATHAVTVWEMDGTNVLAQAQIGTINAGGGWQFQRIGDFNGDHKSDLLFTNPTTGGVAIWQINGTQVEANPQIGILPAGWHLASIGDYNGDSKTDLLFENETTHVLMQWQMDGTQIVRSVDLGVMNAPADWHLVS